MKYLIPSIISNMEMKVKSSSFISYLAPIEYNIKDIISANKRAKHFIEVKRILNKNKEIEEIIYADKEPGGTAGAQLMRALKTYNIINVHAFTFRYFGGILLGKSNLAKAYYEGCINLINAEINAGNIKEYEEIHSLQINFKDMDKFKKLLKYYGLKLINIKGEIISFSGNLDNLEKFNNERETHV